MHPNPIYRQTDEATALAFARERGFGVLAVNGADGPLLSHVPFVLKEDAAELHLVRSNPIARADGGAACLAVSGGDGYVSPDWYGLEHQVPTWMYVAVHLRGVLHPLPQEEMPRLLDELSDAFEERLAPKPVWKMSKMPADALDRMMRQIRPFRLEIETVDSTWKLGQNKPEAARLAAAEGLEAAGLGAETAALAATMRRGRA